MDVLHLGGSLGAEARNDQSRAGPQVMGIDRRAIELLHAHHRGGFSVDVNVGTHALQLRAVAEEAGFVNALGQAAGSLCQRHTDADLGLHIRGEAGIRAGLHRGLPQCAGTHDPDGIVKDNDLGAHLLQLAGNALHVLGDHVLHKNVSSGSRHRRHVSARLDLVRDDGIAAAPEAVDAPDLHGIRARAGNACAHGIQKVGQIHNMGLLGRVFDHRLAGQQGRRHHDIHSGTHAGHIQCDSGPMEAALRGFQGHIVLPLIHVRAQSQKALDVLIDGPGCKIAAAGQGHMGMAEAAQQRAHEIIAGPHLFDQFRVRLGTLHL